jgi:hypothetical protein
VVSDRQLNRVDIKPDFREEANRIMEQATAEGILLRLMGALAFNLHCPKFRNMQALMGRTFSDIDFASYRRHVAGIRKLLSRLGYEEDSMVTNLYGNRRLVFNDPRNDRHCDVFLDKLEFCHDIAFEGRLEVDSPTIPLAELLLEKMQIVKLNEKDVVDTVMLLREHPVGDSDSETINSTHIAGLTARDWGLWRTVTSNLNRIKQLIPDMEKLSKEDRIDVSSKIDSLLSRVDIEPKTTGWKMRAKIGEKKKWYRDVEELTQL